MRLPWWIVPAPVPQVVKHEERLIGYRDASTEPSMQIPEETFKIMFEANTQISGESYHHRFFQDRAPLESLSPNNQTAQQPAVVNSVTRIETLFNMIEIWFLHVDIDWWWFVLFMSLPLLKLVIFWWLFRGKPKTACVLIEAKLKSILIPKPYDPASFRLHIDAVFSGQDPTPIPQPEMDQTPLNTVGKIDAIPAFRSIGSPIETEQPGTCRFDRDDSEFTFAVDESAMLPDQTEVAQPNQSSFFSLIRSSGTQQPTMKFRIQLIEAKTDRVIFTGFSNPRSFAQLKDAADEKINNKESEDDIILDRDTIQSSKLKFSIEFKFSPIRSWWARFWASRHTLEASFRKRSMLVVVSVLMNFTLGGLLLSAGIRFLFSGAFIASIVGICEAGILMILNGSVLIYWAALKIPKSKNLKNAELSAKQLNAGLNSVFTEDPVNQPTDSNLGAGSDESPVSSTSPSPPQHEDGLLTDEQSLKLFLLNSQARAVINLLFGISLGVVAFLTSSSKSADEWFGTLSTCLLVNAALFSWHFVTHEARGQISALFHLNCFK